MLVMHETVQETRKRNITVGYQILDLRQHANCNCAWCRIQKQVYEDVNRFVFGRKRDPSASAGDQVKTGKCVKCGVATWGKMYCGACKKKVWEKAL